MYIHGTGLGVYNASTYSATRADGLMASLMEEFVYWILEMRRYFKQKRNFVSSRKRGSL